MASGLNDQSGLGHLYTVACPPNQRSCCRCSPNAPSRDVGQDVSAGPVGEHGERAGCRCSPAPRGRVGTLGGVLLCRLSRAVGIGGGNHRKIRPLNQPGGWAWFMGSSASRQNKSCSDCNFLVAKQYKSYVYYDDCQPRKGTVLLWRRRAHLLLSLLLQNLVKSCPCSRVTK
jgi:hypothetical protein